MFQDKANEFKTLVVAGNNELALSKLKDLKSIMIDLDSLPPLCLDTANAVVERNTAKHILEYAVLLSVNVGDKEAFNRNMSCLRPYYANIVEHQESDITSSILGLNLLYLLVENRLSDFHCELELLSEAMRVQPAITFCTQLDKHLVVGSYDQVLVAAANPPVKFYSYFLTSLLETVRINIGECVSSAYDSLTLVAATKILMFENKEETAVFIADYYPGWIVEGDSVRTSSAEGAVKTTEISSMKLITQNLAYATELERIV